MCVCMYVCMYVCMNVCMYSYMYGIFIVFSVFLFFLLDTMLAKIYRCVCVCGRGRGEW